MIMVTGAADGEEGDVNADDDLRKAAILLHVVEFPDTAC